MTLLGFTFADKTEVLSKGEIVEKFDLKRLSRSPTKFDINKLNWFAKKYFKRHSNSYLIKELGLEEGA